MKAAEEVRARDTRDLRISSADITEEERDTFVERIISLCFQKNYKEETIHLAISVFDKVLSLSKMQNLQADTLPLLLVTCVIIAAKVE